MAGTHYTEHGLWMIGWTPSAEEEEEDAADYERRRIHADERKYGESLERQLRKQQRYSKLGEPQQRSHFELDEQERGFAWVARPHFNGSFSVPGITTSWFKRPEYASGMALAPFIRQPNTEVRVSVPQCVLLWLWAASVTQFQHKDLRWDACLSAGAQVVQHFVAARPAGEDEVMDRPARWDPETEARLVPADPQPAGAYMPVDETRVMGFRVLVAHHGGAAWHVYNPYLTNWVDRHGDQDGGVIVNYMLAALESWAGREVELGLHAYQLYRSFRPRVRSVELEPGPDFLASLSNYHVGLRVTHELIRWKDLPVPHDLYWWLVVEDCNTHSSWWRETACGDAMTR
ncbi:hypothetical protein GGTG_13120 [Gaeumannomyces tritici R3-111a-1]|uniref:Uncharacterized protein n=1 Tax=Gaeumannomyces tritici (strain R3-111a-1) TaxID=644352 RepID=J3PHY9_GAET3|nr:hypothetical protein GGTG_13120 [Gaeumannomyces tritici R3-111a-1]EJT69501.1 hypothetical protein GGTG_13120 [Gaeumannomyces tritici R3-111a-1]